MLKAVNIHDLAREFLSKDGLKLKDTQKKAIFDFADWVFQKAAQRVQSGACLFCQGRGYILNVYREAAECPTCDGTGKRSGPKDRYTNTAI